MGFSKVSFVLVVQAIITLSIVDAQLTKADVHDIKSLLADMMREDVETNAEFNLIGGCLRLMFHDCVGGEIDGCIQLTNPSNKGLEAYIARLEAAKIFQNFDICKADLFVLCGYTALEVAANNTGNPAVTAIVKDKLKYQFGRKDTTGTCPSRSFPDFTLNPTGYLRKKKNFANLTHSQAVALLGCHSTGRAHVESSGYRHSWVVDNTALTNDYYQLLSNTSLDWHVAYVTHDGVTKVQWELNTGTKTIMLLHQDASLWYKIKLGNGGVPKCGYPGSPSSPDFPRLPECAPAAEREFVKAFRDDLLLWIRELCDGIMIMTTVAESNLTDPFD